MAQNFRGPFTIICVGRVLGVLLTVLVMPLWGMGCGDDPLRVTTIQLGRSLNPDNSVASHTTAFKPTDTIYVSVLTAESGAGTFSARWTYAGRVVDEPTKTVSYQGAGATEFHLQGAGGVPPGEYSVEIFLDGTSVGSRAFRVDQ